MNPRSAAIPIGEGARPSPAVPSRGSNAYAVLVALCMGCSSEDGATNGNASVGSSAKLMPSGSGPAAGDSASGGPSAAAKPQVKLAGSWQADFEAAKGSVTLDPGVKDKAWTKDDGTAASGKGRIELTVDAEGAVTGKLSGALGDAAITGWVDDTGLNATFTPPDSSGDGPRMSGTIALKDEGGQLKGTLRAASGDATLVRIATLALARR